MASLVTYSNGLKRVDFQLHPGAPRRSVRLGRLPQREALVIKRHIEQLVSDKLTGRPHDAETARWLGGLQEPLLGRLRAAGLAQGVGAVAATVGELMDRVLATATVKPGTLKFYGHTVRNLRAYFGDPTLIGSITAGDADRFKAWLIHDQGLAPATVGRRVSLARTFWRQAQRWQMASSNPFEGIRGESQCNDARLHFVSPHVIDRVIAAAPSAEWAALIGLARYGGLRCPSETLTLRWRDIDWERGAIRVTSPKTAHHVGRGHRTIPLFTELIPLLEAVWEETGDAGGYVITAYREPTANLRSQFQRIIRRAGVEPWPRLWQNLRASRESELMREYDLTTVCRWIGNSPAVAAKHYAMSIDLDSDFRRANGMDGADEAQQKAQQTVTDVGGQQGTAARVAAA